MIASKGYLVPLLALLLSLLGCSQSASPTDPAYVEPVESIESEHELTHNLLGYFTFECDPSANKIDIIQLRGAQLHLNALKFLEPPALVYLTLEGPPQFSGNVVDIDIGLRNPYLGMDQFTGFDVCGIVFTHGSVTGFSDPDIVMAGEGDTRLLNADGYARWWNPSEFPHGDTIFNYTDGMLGTPADSADFNCTINGYKYFADGLAPDDPLTTLDITKRGMFSAGGKNIRHYTIDMSGGLIFNYAIDACWKKPTGDPPYDVPDDFPPGANRPEAWNVSIMEVENDLYFNAPTGFAGGNLRILVDVWDHFNANLNHVYAESLAGLHTKAALNPIGGGAGYSTYELDLTGEYLTKNGDAELFIAVQSNTAGYGGALPGKPICAYFKHTFSISPDIPPAWARTWGGENNDYGNGVAVDGFGNIYVTGCFSSTVDFDPGLGVEEHSGYGAFLSKFDSMGDFKWVRTWAASGSDVAVDGTGDIYITGYFFGTKDFDPGPGVDEHTSYGEADAFISKFDTNGDFQWARTWGGHDDQRAYGVDTSGSGTSYVVGTFLGTVDLDPGPGIDEHNTNGDKDIFISAFDANGEFQWGHTWGGNTHDWAWSISENGLGDIYIVGTCFSDTIDFDPGPGVDEHSGICGFLSKFDSVGNFKWAATWVGGAYMMYADDVFPDKSGNIYVTGAYSTAVWTGPVDFDPGPGTENRWSKGHTLDVYMSKFNSEGTFQWVKTWGGLGSEHGMGIGGDGFSDIYVTGWFTKTGDFLPGPGVVEYTSLGGEDVFISKFDSSGTFQWARTWGGTGTDSCRSVAIDGLSNSYTTGYFSGTVDFDPGIGTDYHTSHGEYDVYLSKFSPDGYW